MEILLRCFLRAVTGAGLAVATAVATAVGTAVATATPGLYRGGAAPPNHAIPGPSKLARESYKT